MVRTHDEEAVIAIHILLHLSLLVVDILLLVVDALL